VKRPNILLVVLDAVRFDHLSCYGYERKTTPNIDKLSTRGILFENAFSTSCWTPPSHASLFTGLYPSFHGVYTGDSVLDVSEKTLVEILRDAGYRTLGISSIPQLSITKKFNRGFDEYVEAWKLDQTRRTALKWKAKIRSFFHLDDPVTRYIYEQIRRWIKERNPSTPFFIFANMNTAHSPYDPPTRYLSRHDTSPASFRMTKRLKDLAARDGYRYMARQMEVTEDEFKGLECLYDGEITYLDELLGYLFIFLQAKGLLEDTLILLLADHGENFGDHGLMYHQFCLYDSLIRIPMIWHYPRAILHGERISTLASIVDVMPSILGLAALPLESYSFTQGTCLFPGFLSCHPEGRNFVVAEYQAPPGVFNYFRRMTPDFDHSVYERGYKSIRTLHYKYIVSSKGHEELYDLAKDPEEEHNVVNLFREEVDRLRQTLFKTVRDFEKERGAKSSEEKDDATIQQLKALGYL
jgi:arylsulfatase A-like enzyme